MSNKIKRQLRASRALYHLLLQPCLFIVTFGYLLAVMVALGGALRSAYILSVTSTVVCFLTVLPLALYVHHLTRLLGGRKTPRQIQ